jgi:N-acetylneuraminic acid mutarotase
MKQTFALLLIMTAFITGCIIVTEPASAVSPNSWTEKTPMQVARSSLGVAVVDGKIYAIGGTTYTAPSTGGAVSTNEMYDPETDTWVFKASMPTARAYFATAVFDDKIYCIGGSGGVNEVYDPKTDTWENRTSMPTARWALQANVVNGKIYLIGGYNFDDSAFGGSRTSLNEIYDPATDTWTTGTPIPIATADYSSAVFDKKIYILGGLSSSPRSNINQIYDPATDSWSQGALSPSGLRYCAAGATTGVNATKRIYVFGPTMNLWEGESTATVRIYNPATDRWTTGASMTTSRYSFGVAVVNDTLYTIGGYTVNKADVYYSNDYSITEYATNEEYLPLGYGTPDPSYDGTAPKIEIISSQQESYSSTNITLDFTVDESVSTMNYVLDNGTAIEISGNLTLTGLSYGSHNLTVYATDKAGNIGASPTMYFTIVEPVFGEEVVSTAVMATIVIVLALITGFGLLVYFKRRHR